jgi:hypothetical protein
MRNLLIVLLLFCFVETVSAFSGSMSGSFVAFRGPSGEYESYTTGQDGYGSVWSTAIVIAQTFTPTLSHRIDYVYIYALRVGTPGNIKIDIYATSAGKPTGSVLATSGNVSANGFDTSFSWQKISLISGYNLSALTMYAIVVSKIVTDADNYVRWGDDGTSPTYSGGTYVYSIDTGSTWTISTGDDLLFKEGQN